MTCLVLFLYWFRSHARCGCCSIACLRLQLPTQEYEATKKQIVGLRLNEKMSKKSRKRIMSCYCKGKPTWRKDLKTYNNHPWIMFSLNWLVIIWRTRGRGVRLKLDVQGPGAGRIFDVDRQRGGGSWKMGNFHGRHICIIPRGKFHYWQKLEPCKVFHTSFSLIYFQFPLR